MIIKDTHSIHQIGDFVVQTLASLLETTDTISLALSGGNTPKALFQYWVQHYKTNSIWHHIQYFWVDERCVLPTYDESNYGVAHSLFFEPMNISHSQIFRMKGEEYPQKEALRYHSLLSQTLPHTNGIPQFDCVLLGIGDDGHTASIFPGSENLFSIPQHAVVAQNPYNNQWRITITGPVINNAKHVMFIATGESKTKILQEIVHPTSIKIPAQFVNPSHGLLTLLTDIKL